MSKINPPELEQEIGILCYKSKTKGIAGAIKQLPEDFIVEEMARAQIGVGFMLLWSPVILRDLWVRAFPIASNR